MKHLFLLIGLLTISLANVAAQNCGQPLNATAHINLSGFYATQTLSKGQIARKTITGSGIGTGHSLGIVTTTGKVSLRIVAVIKGGTRYIIVGSCRTVSTGGQPAIVPLQIPSGTTELRYEILATDGSVKVDWQYQ